ncbi:PPC domain-containing protein [Calothrix rhizosoleniae]|uniref:PPC domain-containing protein n=1 Tax=Calothrix rhizosoleniae TaxID=888997 RepID=UPI000B4A0E52|nr:PPC domain-containing protein [Calothrix rhizosoleniae]
MFRKAFVIGLRLLTTIPVSLLTIGVSTTATLAQVNKLYNPIPIPPSHQIADSLSEKDIPTGQGGFARDYLLKLNKGDNLAIDLSSENFDSIITLLGPNGATIAENDDGPDGTSNSLLFTRINENGTYIVRVRSFGETGIGKFKLKVTKLKPVK